MPTEKEKDAMKIDVPEAKPMEQMPDVEELLKILIDVNMAQNQQTVNLLMNYMNDMEENFFSVLEELDTVKEQLNQIRNTPQIKEIRYTFSELSGQLGEKITSLQGEIQDRRVSLNERAAQLVHNFKEHGVAALNNVCGFLGIKETMTQMKKSLNQTAAAMQHSMDKIDRVNQEFRETTTHARNLGRAIAGTEALPVPQAKQSGFFHGMKKPYQSMKNFCTNKAASLGKAIGRLERLEQSAKKIAETKENQKPSIREKLQSMKESQPKQEKATPTAEKAKKQESSL